MNVNVKLDLDEKALRGIAQVLDRAAGKRGAGIRLATRKEVWKWVADRLNDMESTATVTA